MTTALSPALLSTLAPVTTELQTPQITPSPTQPGAPSFGDRVSEAMTEIERLDGAADRAAHGYLTGEHQDVHGTMIAMQEADVSMRLAVSVRNRVIEAYREVMRMGS